MYKVKIFCIGKTREPWLKHAIEEYTTRLLSFLSIEWVLVKRDDQLKKKLTNDPYIALDPKGQALTSGGFSTYLFEALQETGCRLSFAIGGAEGLSQEVIDNALGSISLSPMTFTHQMTRLILLEQIYRACEIAKGSSYHK